jgi:hypothetical protein
MSDNRLTSKGRAGTIATPSRAGKDIEVSRSVHGQTDQMRICRFQ